MEKSTEKENLVTALREAAKPSQNPIIKAYKAEKPKALYERLGLIDRIKAVKWRDMKSLELPKFQADSQAIFLCRRVKAAEYKAYVSNGTTSPTELNKVQLGTPYIVVSQVSRLSQMESMLNKNPNISFERIYPNEKENAEISGRHDNQNTFTL